MPNEPYVPDFENEPSEIVPGYEPEPNEQPLPEVDEPLVKADPMAPWKDPASLRGQEILGPYDAWLGEVVQVNYVSGDALYGDVQRVSVRRCDVWYSTNNEPVAVDIPQVLSQPTPTLVEAMPFPLRHDQANYHVQVGDIVTVLDSRDDRHWFLLDELPFVATVIDNTEEGGGTEVAEDFCGGAGNVSLCVRRRVLAGDPDGDDWLGATVSTDLKDAADAEIEYTGVKPIGPTNVNHGYRVGDLVWVHRRGRYFFCTPGRQGFIAQVVTTGPDGETEPSDNGYYVKETDWTITYTNEKADYTVSTGVRTAAVAGQSGTNGRWVLAINRSLNDSGHTLATDGTVYVWVDIIADPATGEVGYSFYHETDVGRVRFGKATETATAPAPNFVWEVDVNPCSGMDGSTPDTDTTHTVYLQPTVSDPFYSPAVYADDVISYTVDENGNYSGVQFAMAPVVGSYRFWHDMDNIPTGWEAVTDAKGRLLRVWDDTYAPASTDGSAAGPPYTTSGPSAADKAVISTDPTAPDSVATEDHTHTVDPNVFHLGLIKRTS